MANLSRNGVVERDVKQAITALKKGAYLLKYGRRGKPKFCPFRLSNDETALIWYSGNYEKQLKLSSVSRIIPGQHTAIFQRYPQPEKEYQSFSLICNDRSLNLICKDEDQAEFWLTGLTALMSNGHNRKWKFDTKSDGTVTSDVSSAVGNSRKISPLSSPFGSTESLSEEGTHIHCNSNPYRSSTCQKTLSEDDLHARNSKSLSESRSVGGSVHSMGSDDRNLQMRASSLEAFRVSLSSAISSSSKGSGQDECNSLGDVFMWGEGIGEGFLGGGTHRIGQTTVVTMDSLLPKVLESVAVLDVQYISCGGRHAALVTKNGEAFCWGEESGGRLGHGFDTDISHPKKVETLANTGIDFVACGEYHTCAVTFSGELYTWGNGTQHNGLLGHGNDVNHWIPKKVNGCLDGIYISFVSCGPWHTALVTSAGQLFTFGDGTFGALGHGSRNSSVSPQEVESLKGLRTVRVACGFWHTAALVEVMIGSASCTNRSSGKLFTWGDGDKFQLGLGDTKERLVPTCVPAVLEYNFLQVACGHSLTVALTTAGQIFTMGSTVYGQLGVPEAAGKIPSHVEGKLYGVFVEEVACGAFHVAVLTSKSEVYTWGRGANGRLGHGDTEDRSIPTVVEALKYKHVKSIACGSSFTAAICLHKCVSATDQLICSGCRIPFGFTRKRHNCYNCGLAFCHACSLKKSPNASLSPNPSKQYRVCDSCFIILSKADATRKTSQVPETKRMDNMQQSTELKAKQGQLDVKITQRQLPNSRLTAVEQFKKNKGKSFPKHNRKSESTCVSPVRNNSSQWGKVHTSSALYAVFGPSRRISASVPHSRIISRATSPISSRKPSPPHSAAMALTSNDLGFAPLKVIDGGQPKTNEILQQEVLMLQAKVENLNRHSQIQEEKLKHSARQLQEAIAIAREEAAKCKAAKEAIKSLTAQLNSMSEILPGGIYGNGKLGTGATFHAEVLNGVNSSTAPNGLPLSETIHSRQRQTSTVRPSSISPIVSDSLQNRKISLPIVSNGSLTSLGKTSIPNRLPDDVNEANVLYRDDNGLYRVGNTMETKIRHEPGVDWVVQDDPGVYMTLTALPDGGNDLKRLRFSRKRFNERQAELWWQENKARVHEQYNVQAVERSGLRSFLPPRQAEHL